MANIRLVVNNAWDLSSPSATSEVVGMEIGNTRLTSSGKVWQSTALSDQTILGDFSVPGTLCSILSIYRHNFSTSATVRLQLFDGASQTGTTVYDSGVISILDVKAADPLEWGVDGSGTTLFDEWDFKFSNLWYPEVGAQSYSIIFSDATNPDGYMRVSRIFLSKYESPEFNMGYGASISWIDPSKQQRTAGGSMKTIKQVRYRELQLTLPHMTDDQGMFFMEGLMIAGKSKDVFISAYPEVGGRKEQLYTMQAKVVDNIGVSTPAFNTNAMTIKLQDT